jgi:hypothetical protein
MLGVLSLSMIRIGPGTSRGPSSPILAGGLTLLPPPAQNGNEQVLAWEWLGV